MLYQFKSKVTGNVIMLQPNGEQVLQIIGKHSAADPSTKGILLPEQMPQALADLEAAIARENAARAEALAQAKVDHVPEVLPPAAPVPRGGAVALSAAAKKAVRGGSTVTGSTR